MIPSIFIYTLYVLTPRAPSNDPRKTQDYAVAVLSHICTEGCIYTVAIMDIREKLLAVKFPCSLADLPSVRLQCLSSSPSHHFAKLTLLF